MTEHQEWRVQPDYRREIVGDPELVGFNILSADGVEVLGEEGIDMRYGEDKAKSLADQICNEHNAVRAVMDALRNIAAYPLEEFDQAEKPDAYQLCGANQWRLTVGDVRAARAALKLLTP